MIFSRLKRLLGNDDKPRPVRVKKRVISRDAHGVSRKNISDNALKVLYRLNKAGYDAYLVGGGVRDVLLDLHPKDFDVATNAKPEEIQRVFRNSRAIGRRFRLVHVLFGQDIVEVATFRAHNEDAPQSENGMVLRDNVYGNIEDDAVRRDFTVNALYYNIADFSVIDFVGGLDDLKKRQLRLIGDPATRYREDPVRMLRAARLAAKLQFSIDKHTRAPIAELADLLHHVSNARLWDECAKLFLTGHAEASYQQLKALGLFAILFPDSADALKKNPGIEALFLAALRNTDTRLRAEKGVNPAFLFAVLLWPSVAEHVDRRLGKGEMPAIAIQHAMNTVLDNQHRITAIAKRFAMTMRDMWGMQWRFNQRTPARAEKLLALPKFRAAFDLLDLRVHSEPQLTEMRDWWLAFQEADASQRQRLLDSVPKMEHSAGKKRPRRNTKARRKPKRADAE